MKEWIDLITVMVIWNRYAIVALLVVYQVVLSVDAGEFAVEPPMYPRL